MACSLKWFQGSGRCPLFHTGVGADAVRFMNSTTPPTSETLPEKFLVHHIVGTKRLARTSNFRRATGGTVAGARMHLFSMLPRPHLSDRGKVCTSLFFCCSLGIAITFQIGLHIYALIKAVCSVYTRSISANPTKASSALGVRWRQRTRPVGANPTLYPNPHPNRKANLPSQG